MGNVFYRNIKETIKSVLHNCSLQYSNVLLKLNSINELFLFDVCRIREFLESTLKRYCGMCKNIFEDEEIINLYAQITRIV